MQFQHIDPQAAVEIHEDVQSNFSIGIHWGTFNLSYEVSTLLISNFTSRVGGEGLKYKKRWGCSSRILKLTPKGDQSGRCSHIF